MLRILSLTVALFFASSIFATNADIEVWNRTFVSSCGYYSGTTADWDVTFKDTSLPWGAKVTLVSAFGGYFALGGGAERTFNWERPLEVAMDSIAPSTWRTRRSEQIHSRTSNRFVTALQFVFRVEVPGSAPTYVNGGTAMGHYEVASRIHGAPCVDSTGALPGFVRDTVKIVQ